MMRKKAKNNQNPQASISNRARGFIRPPKCLKTKHLESMLCSSIFSQKNLKLRVWRNQKKKKTKKKTKTNTKTKTETKTKKKKRKKTKNQKNPQASIPNKACGDLRPPKCLKTKHLESMLCSPILFKKI